ncbi:MAG: response regulator [Chthoniobacterales bacterium]
MRSLAADHPVIREGLVVILKQKDIEIVGEAADGEQTCKLYQEFSPDVLMVDLRIPRRMVCKL